MSAFHLDFNLTTLRCESWETKLLLSLTCMCRKTTLLHSFAPICLLTCCLWRAALIRRWVGHQKYHWRGIKRQKRIKRESAEVHDTSRKKPGVADQDKRLTERTENEDPSGPNLGFLDGGHGLDLCGLYYGYGGLEDLVHWGHGRLVHHHSGLVLVQFMEILFYRFNFCHQLLWFPCALVCGGYVSICRPI